MIEVLFARMVAVLVIAMAVVMLIFWNIVTFAFILGFVYGFFKRDCVPSTWPGVVNDPLIT